MDENFCNIIPYDEEIERMVIGCIMSETVGMPQVYELGLRAEYFYKTTNQLIFDAIQKADDRGIIPTADVVIRFLREKTQLEEVGGEDYIKSLNKCDFFKENLWYFIHTLKENYLRRNILKLSVQMKHGVFHKVDNYEIMEKIQVTLLDLSKKTTSCSHSARNDVLKRALNDIDKVFKSKNPVAGISSGFSILDTVTKGFKASDYIVIYGNYKIQYFIWKMLANIILNQKVPTAYFSLGTSDVALMKQLLVLDSGIDNKNLLSGNLSSNDYLLLMKSIGRMDEAPLYIVDNSEMNIFDIYSNAVKLKISKDIEMIFIDNFHLIHSVKRTSISKIIKRLARELAIPVILLYGNDTNILHANVWENIRRDADTIIHLNEKEVDKGLLCLEKNRHGIIGEVEFDSSFWNQIINDEQKENGEV